MVHKVVDKTNYRPLIRELFKEYDSNKKPQINVFYLLNKIFLFLSTFCFKIYNFESNSTALLFITDTLEKIKDSLRTPALLILQSEYNLQKLNFHLNVNGFQMLFLIFVKFFA